MDPTLTRAELHRLGEEKSLVEGSVIEKTKKEKVGQAWWCTPVILGPLEVEAGGLQQREGKKRRRKRRKAANVLRPTRKSWEAGG